MKAVSVNTLLSILIAGLLALPILYVLSHILLSTNNDVWLHLRQTVLKDYIFNSILLATCVGAISTAIGVPSAWFISRYQFPGRAFFQWALLLPMSLPAYILAFTYAGLLDIAGPAQTLLRQVFALDINEYYFPEIRSLPGASIILSLVLYPYIYLLARASFLEQSQHSLNVGRSLGLNTRQTFLKIALPMARPGIIAGISIVMMETLADYGVVQYFGLPTLTTGIFRTWFGMDNPQAAAQLAAFLLVIVFIVLYCEKQSRRKTRYHQLQSLDNTTLKPSNLASFWIIVFCAMPVLFGFIVPVVQLLSWAVKRIPTLDIAFLKLCWNSFYLALICAFIASCIALFLHTSLRFSYNRTQSISVFIASLGYAIPGIVIAVGVVVIAGKFDQLYNSATTHQGLLLSGSLGILIYAYIVRFLAAASNSIETGFSKIHTHLDESAQSLGLSKLTIIKKIHLPLMRTSLLTALLIVFVDTLKELPATLIMRPFNFNTLAVRTYELAIDERLADAALPALAIVLTGLIPVILLLKTSTHKVKSRYE